MNDRRSPGSLGVSTGASAPIAAPLTGNLIVADAEFHASWLSCRTTRSAPDGPAMAQGTSALTPGSRSRWAIASMMPARSPGAKPVRHARASSGEVSQVTAVIAIAPRSWASTSPMSPYSTRARPWTPPPHSLASRPILFSGMTIVIPENRIGREAQECGGGLAGRARVLYGLMGEVEAQLRGAMAMTAVTWLTSPQLALACRTGFAPGDRAGIIDAIAQRERDPGVNADVPWAMAGPSGADLVVRHYSHDAWNSASATIKLPVKGAAMGALAPVLTPSEPGERRSFMVAYPILRQSKADRQSANSEWAADVGAHLRTKAGVKQRAKQRAEAAKAHGMDDKLARGNSMTRPYAVCTVTVPKTARVAEYARRLDAAVRRAGFAPLRLDLSQDAAFAASTIPLGISLSRKGDA